MGNYLGYNYNTALETNLDYPAYYLPCTEEII